MHSRWFLFLFFFTLCSCERCSNRVPEELRVLGPTPYVRCLAADPPEARKWRVGRVQFELRGRVLTILAPSEGVRIAVFSGPAFASAPPTEALKKVAAARPRLVFMLGGPGDERNTAASNLRLLAGFEFPTLVIAGGRDRWSDYQGAFRALEDEERNRVIDITALRSIKIGTDEFVPVGGAANGHYARDEFACGYSDADLEVIRGEIGPRGAGRRWLLSWQVPAGEGPLAVSKTSRGVQIGDSALARFADQVKAPGGFFAWPDVQVMRPRAHRETLNLPIGVVADDLRLVVPRLVGPFIERDDATRVQPGFALTVLTKAGMLLEAP
jgi:hypothetical protein